jgi:hypothetical protein
VNDDRVVAPRDGAYFVVRNVMPGRHRFRFEHID